MAVLHSACLPTCLPVCLFACLSACLPICLSVALGIYRGAHCIGEYIKVMADFRSSAHRSNVTDEICSMLCVFTMAAKNGMLMELHSATSSGSPLESISWRPFANSLVLASLHACEDIETGIRSLHHIAPCQPSSVGQIYCGSQTVYSWLARFQDTYRCFRCRRLGCQRQRSRTPWSA